MSRYDDEFDWSARARRDLEIIEKAEREDRSFMVVLSFFFGLIAGIALAVIINAVVR